MWWLIIAVCCLAILSYLVFAPFFFEIDSINGLFRIRFHRLAAANLNFNDGSVFLELKIALWKKKIDLAEIKKNEQKTTVKKEKKKRNKIQFQKMLAVVKSFRVKKLFLTLDTGNVQLNGILYPLFVLLEVSTGKNISINFLDENKLILQVKNNFARMMWAYIKS